MYVHNWMLYLLCLRGEQTIEMQNTRDEFYNTSLKNVEKF